MDLSEKSGVLLLQSVALFDILKCLFRMAGSFFVGPNGSSIAEGKISAIRLIRITKSSMTSVSQIALR